MRVPSGGDAVNRESLVLALVESARELPAMSAAATADGPLARPVRTIVARFLVSLGLPGYTVPNLVQLDDSRPLEGYLRSLGMLDEADGGNRLPTWALRFAVRAARAFGPSATADLIAAVNRTDAPAAARSRVSGHLSRGTGAELRRAMQQITHTGRTTGGDVADVVTAPLRLGAAVLERGTSWAVTMGRRVVAELAETAGSAVAGVARGLGFQGALMVGAVLVGLLLFSGKAKLGSG